MPFSPLDPLMQATTPARCLEPPARSDAPAFAPALEQAYQAESPRSVPPAPQKPQAPKADAAVASDRRQGSEEPTDNAVATAEGAEHVEKSHEQAEQDAEETQEDAVEISAEAAAAAGIVQEASNVEQQVVVKASDDANEADEVKPIDPQAAADAAQKQSEGDAAAKSTQETDAAGEGSDGESSEEESAEPIVSALNSTRRGQTAGAAKAQADVASDGETADKSKTKNPEGIETAAQADAEQTTLKPVDELSIDSSTDTESKSEPRDQVSAEKSTKDAESRLAAPKFETPTAGDAAAVATTTSTDNIELLAADVSNAAPVAAATDGAPPAADGSQRASSALDRLMAGHSLKQSKEAGEPNGMPAVDRARFVQRVEGAMKAAQQRDGKIQVRLSPPDLGSVKIELAVQNGVLSAKLEAETPAARNLLLDSLPALRERLAQQDIRVEKFDVDVRRDGGGNDGGGQAEDRTADQSGERQSGRQRTAARAVALPAASPRHLAASSSAAAGLDIRV